MKPTLILSTASLVLLALPGCRPDAVAAAGQPAGEPAGEPAGASAALPLEHGYYVRTDETCADASSAGVHLLNATGLRWVTSYCVFDRIERTGETSWRVHQSCGDRHPAGQEVAEYEIPDRRSFSFTTEHGWEHAARLCPQQEMPEPWRSEDIRALVEQGD